MHGGGTQAIHLAPGVILVKKIQHGEPALGTVDERLDIITRRLGGKTGAVRMSDDERREYHRWLAVNGLAS